MGLVLASYLAGGIPTGYLAAKKLKGIDIRDYGSGNPGTANVYRVAGAKAGAITLLVDALKGYLPAVLAQRLYPDRPWVLILCGAAAIIGHDWTVFLGFRGGKGVATSAGVFTAMMPKTMLVTLLIFIAAFRLSGHISVGSMAGAAALPLVCLALSEPHSYAIMAACACLLILYKHIPNIRKLLERKELSISDEK